MLKPAIIWFSPDEPLNRMVLGEMPRKLIISPEDQIFKTIFRDTIPQTLNPILSEYRRLDANKTRSF